MHVKLMVAGFTVLSAFALTASPFDDAKFWFRGGKPSHGAGTAVTDDFWDATHANDATHKNHTSKIYGYDEDRAFRVEDVTFPCSGETRQMQVLHLGMQSHDDGSGNQTVWPGAVSLHALRDVLVKDGVPTSKFTIVMRLRRDGSPWSPNVNEWFLQWGYTGFAGLLFGFGGTELNAKNEDVGKHILGYRLVNKADGTGTELSKFELNSESSMNIPTNMWVDIGISVDGENIQFAIAKPKTARPASVETWRDCPPVSFATVGGCVKVTNNFTGTESADTKLSTSRFAFGAQTGALLDAPSAYPPTSSAAAAFRGSLQQFAIWDRALTREEMLDAFGMPRPMVVQLGLRNDGSSEFGGARPVSGEQTIDADGLYDEKSSLLSAGDKTTVTFNLRAEESGLRQHAWVRLTSESAAGRLSLLVNGVDCGTADVEPGKTAWWNVPGQAMIAGSNVLKISRVDGGSGQVEIDDFALGGSWQVGVVGDDSFCGEADIQANYLGGADNNLRHWPSMFSTYGHPQDVRIRFWVDGLVAASTESKFTFPMQFFCNGQTETRQGSEHLLMTVNGVTKKDIPAGPADWARLATKTINLDFVRGELLPGWNELNVQFLPKDGAGKYTAYIKNDYYRFEVGKLHKGLMILLK